jgi:hypothetical protein
LGFGLGFGVVLGFPPGRGSLVVGVVLGFPLGRGSGLGRGRDAFRVGSGRFGGRAFWARTDASATSKVIKVRALIRMAVLMTSPGDWRVRSFAQDSEATGGKRTILYPFGANRGKKREELSARELPSPVETVRQGPGKRG